MSINISNDIKLSSIIKKDSDVLYQLMKEIYPPAYSHFWEDGGDWYINSQYSYENLATELLEENQLYYFVIYNNEIIGILRILLKHPLNIFPNKRAIKLHRIYLRQKIQGLGIGKQLINYVEQFAKQKGYKIVWLEVMKAQPQAFNFYKKLDYNVADEYSYDKNLLFNKYRSMLALYKEIC